MTRFAIGLMLLTGASAASAQTDFGIRTVSGNRGIVTVGTHPKVGQAQPTGEVSVPRETSSNSGAWARLNTRGSGNLGSAASIGQQWGRVTSTYRTPQHNRRVGGVRNSYHLSGRAIDIARRPGVTHSQIAAAFRNAGYHLIESLDEGDHSHFAFGFGGRGSRTASAPSKGELTKWGVVTVSTALLR